MPVETKKHPAIPAVDEDCALWRFMSVSKFVSLLTANSLVFPQVALLSSRDPKEGRFTNLNYQLAKQIDEDDQLAKLLGEAMLGEKPIDIKMVRQLRGAGMLRVMDQIGQRTHYVNCWNMSEHEPAQLWSMYASENDGVAIKSSVSSLTQALSSSENNIFLGKIEYKDYDQSLIQSGNSFYPIFSKRVEFSHEKEFRLCISYTPEIPSGQSVYQNLHKCPRIISEPCDLKVLISEIRVAPFAEKWVLDAILNLAKTYGLAAPVIYSSLAK